MKFNNLAYYAFVLTASSNTVLGLEYLVSLKTEGTIQHFMDSTMSKGHSVKDFLGNKIGRTFSIGNFKGLTIELSSRELLEKLKNNPFVADVVPNLQVKAFEQEDYVQYNVTEENFSLDVQDYSRDRRYRAGHGGRRNYGYYDDDESDYDAEDAD